MKKILVAMLLVSIYASAQEYKIEDNAITGVFECQGKTKSQIFSAINKWISINYNSGKSVTQLSDADGGNIVVKGINEVSYPTNSKILFPNMKSLPETTFIKFNHLIEINIKDNRFRINYKIIDIDYDPNAISYLTPEQKKMNIDSVNLNGMSDSVLLEVSEATDANLKKAFIGKEKRTNYIIAMKQMYIQRIIDLVTNMKATISAIQSSVTTPATDGW